MVRSDKRSRLLEAADSLVQRQGFSTTTLAHIAEEADVPLGNVYYYFRTKREIGAAVIGRRADRYRDLRQEWERTLDPRTRLEAFVDMTLSERELLARSGCPIGSLCQELHKEGGDLAEQASAMFSEFLTWLAAQFKLMGKGKESPDLALHLLCSLQGAALLANSFHDPSYVVREAKRLKRWIRST